MTNKTQKPPQTLIAYMVERQRDLEANIFAAPPQDWAEFQRRLGEWQENTAIQAKMIEFDKGIEDDDR